MMCAFMTPVLKNDWEVYQTKNNPHNPHNQRRRTTSESPQKTCQGLNQRAQSGNLRRKVLTNENRSMSFAGHHQRSLSEFALQKGPPPRSYHLSARNSRNASKDSFSLETSGLTSPTKSHPTFPGPKKSPSSSSLTRFHNKVMDKLKSALHMKDQDSDSKGSEDDEENGIQPRRLS